MSATKILWGQVVVVFLIAFGCIWAATEWTARALPPRDEFDFEEGEASEDSTRNLRLRERMSSSVRQAALDPDDGIDL